MTNLEQFLNKEKDKPKLMEPISGSFSCQNSDCREIVFEGYVDKEKNRIHWICSSAHDSSVVF